MLFSIEVYLFYAVLTTDTQVHMNEVPLNTDPTPTSVPTQAEVPVQPSVFMHAGGPTPYQTNAYGQPISDSGEAKERIAYIAFAIVLGFLGVHNFYAGYIKRGVLQLLITVMSLGILFFIPAIWAFIEAFTVKKDAQGIPFSKDL